MEPTDPDDVVRRGWDLYRRRIRHKVEPEHEGRFLVLDVDSGRYVVADDEIEALDQAREQMPTGTFYLVRVGRRIGRSACV